MSKHKAFAQSVEEIVSIKERLANGQHFNAYNTSRAFLVGIGPVTNFLEIARTSSHEVANLLVDALRAASGQPEQLCRVYPSDEDDQ